MQEEFENRVRERMHTFGIQPSPQVWDDIDAVLSKKKHRRIFVGWWILLGLVVMGIAVFMYDKDTLNKGGLNRQPLIISDTLHQGRFAENPTTKQPEGNNHALAKSQTGQIGQPLAPISPNSKSVAAGGIKTIIEGNKAALDNKKNAFSMATHMAGLASGTIPITTKTPQNKKKNISTKAFVNDTLVGGAKTTPLASQSQPTQPLPNAAADTVAQPLNTISDSSANKQVSDKNNLAQQGQPMMNNPKTTAQKRHQLFITFSVGTTQTISSGSINSFSTSPSFGVSGTTSSNVPAVTALGAYIYNIAQPGIGFHVSAGGLYEWQLSPRWKISGGISIAYLSNTQKAGPVYKNALNISTANQLNAGADQITLQSYYQPGTQSLLVNKAWQVQMPLGVSYVFNPAGKTKFMLNGGLSFAWFLSSEWLIPDARYNKLYYSKTVFNNTAVNWQAGPAIEFSNKWRLGLQYQQSFTTMAKSYVNPKLYWQNISIYTAIPFGRKNSTGKRQKVLF